MAFTDHILNLTLMKGIIVEKEDNIVEESRKCCVAAFSPFPLILKVFLLQDHKESSSHWVKS